MSVFRVSYRYANSLMQLSIEKKIYSTVAKDAELVFNSINSSKELRAFLKNPIFKSADKKRLVSEIFGKAISQDTLLFVDFVIEKGREDLLMEIFKEFLNLCDKKEGVLRAKVKSAVELNDSLKKKFIDKLEKQTSKTVYSDYIIDEKIIGGFIVEIEDQVYDASIKHQLNQLRKKFSEEINISNN